MRAHDPDDEVIWLCRSQSERDAAQALGFTAVDRASRHGWWATLTARFVVVTHGLGDANRFGVFGATIVQLWHGAPLKKLHFDAPVTTQLRGPAWLRALLKRMYRSGAERVTLYVAGSPTSADRLRSAFRVLPGRVLTLGDPRDDDLIRALQDPERLRALRAEVLAPAGLMGASLAATGSAATAPADSADSADSADPAEALSPAEPAQHGPILLYAPTWRDGDADPGIPSDAELAQLARTLDALDAQLFIRPHPLSASAWEHVTSPRIHRFTEPRDLTPYLAVFDGIITDYSSAAIDFSLTGRPIVWFAPDLERYALSRGLYEPLEVTAGGRVDRDWTAVCARLTATFTSPTALATSMHATAQLRDRFHTHRDGASAARVLAAVRELAAPLDTLVPENAVLFESFYGRQVACNPLALSAELARRAPELPQLWSVVSETQTVPAGATPVLVGSRHYRAALRRAHLIITNDWLRFGFRRQPGQTVVQTWHGTMLKHLALGRPRVSLRTRLAVHRQSRQWSLLLSQNPHSSAQFRRSYAFRGEILETGYPRDDRLARAVIDGVRHRIPARVARDTLGVSADAIVLAYLPTWRARGHSPADLLRLDELVDGLDPRVVFLVRGHTRAKTDLTLHPRVIDVTGHPDISDVFLAADAVITDYSSVMFDAAVLRLPLVFYTPDLANYRAAERGFTFDFAAAAPGPIVESVADLSAHLAELVPQLADPAAGEPWRGRYRERYADWCDRFVPWDDGAAASRVVDALTARGVLQRS